MSDSRPKGSLGRFALSMETTMAARDEYWRRVLADPVKYGDEMLKARALVSHYKALLTRAQGRLDYLQSLSPKE